MLDVVTSLLAQWIELDASRENASFGIVAAFISYCTHSATHRPRTLVAADYVRASNRTEQERAHSVDGKCEHGIGHQNAHQYFLELQMEHEGKRMRLECITGVVQIVRATQIGPLARASSVRPNEMCNPCDQKHLPRPGTRQSQKFRSVLAKYPYPTTQ